MLNKAAFAGLILIAGSVNAQGYFDFSDLPGLDQQPKVQIDLNPTMLAFVKEFARESDPNAGDLIAGIEGVRVRVYDIGRDADDVLAFIDDASGTLEDDDWQRMVFIDDEDARVRIYVKFDDTTMAGLTLMVAHDEGEAVFVNIAGMVDPAQLGQIAKNLGISDALQSVTGDLEVNGATP